MRPRQLPVACPQPPAVSARGIPPPPHSCELPLLLTYHVGKLQQGQLAGMRPRRKTTVPDRWRLRAGDGENLSTVSMPPR